MQPSNPSNGNPNIIDIMDSNGVKHQVAPVNHTHSQSEVSGLQQALSVLNKLMVFRPQIETRYDGNYYYGVPKYKENNIISAYTDESTELYNLPDTIFQIAEVGDTVKITSASNIEVLEGTISQKNDNLLKITVDAPLVNSNTPFTAGAGYFYLIKA